MDAPEGQDEVIEVEVERLPRPEELRGGPSRRAKAFRARLAPLSAGIIIDVVDFATLGLAGPGLVLGAIAGWILAGKLQFSWRGRLMAAAASGVYCLFPPTTFLPLATLIGALAPVQPDEVDPERG